MKPYKHTPAKGFPLWLSSSCRSIYLANIIEGFQNYYVSNRLQWYRIDAVSTMDYQEEKKLEFNSEPRRMQNYLALIKELIESNIIDCTAIA